MFIESFLIDSITQTTWLFRTKNQASSFFAFGKSRFLCNSCIRISYTKHFLIYIMSDYYNNFRNFTERLCFIFGQKLCMHLKLFGYRSFRISRQLTLLFLFLFFFFRFTIILLAFILNKGEILALWTVSLPEFHPKEKFKSLFIHSLWSSKLNSKFVTCN